MKKEGIVILNTLYFLSAVGLISLFCLIVLGINKYLTQQSLKNDKPPFITCIYCKGTGERKEDVNLIWRDAKMSLWLNKHLNSDKCPNCVKPDYSEQYQYCDEVDKQYQLFIKEYEELGPKFQNTMCGKCMGAGQFQILSKNPKTNQWYTQEDYEEAERNKTKSKKGSLNE